MNSTIGNSNRIGAAISPTDHSSPSSRKPNPSASLSTCRAASHRSARNAGKGMLPADKSRLNGENNARQ